MLLSDVSDCSFIKFHIWDCPGQFDFVDPICQTETMFCSSRAVIFVIDAQVKSVSLIILIPTKSQF